MIDARLGGAGVAAPEEIVVIQFVIKVVKGFANFEAGVERENLFIAFIEVFGESSEHIGEGNIGFTITVIACGIEYVGLTLCIDRKIATPKVAVQERWKRFIFAEEIGYVL